MPVYEYYCDKCEREVTLTMSISKHDKGKIIFGGRSAYVRTDP